MIKNLKTGKIVQFLVNCPLISRKRLHFVFDSYSSFHHGGYDIPNGQGVLL